MNTTEQILLVDDDEVFNTTYVEVLQEDGYSVTPALTATAALALVETQTFDLILLDRKLTGGHGGPDTGLDLIPRLRSLAPTAKIVMITGYADADSVQRAFAEGVYDYIEKSGIFEALLRVKVRNALEAARERRIASLANGKREATIQDLWQSVQHEPKPQKKGKLLEELMLILLKSIPGFERTTPNQRSADEEFDLVVQNDGTDPFWRDDGQYFLVECKNESEPTDPARLDRFVAKLGRRHRRCHLGFLVAIKGFTAGVRSTLATMRKDKTMVILIGKDELEQLINAGNGPKRNEVLRELHQKASVKG